MPARDPQQRELVEAAVKAGQTHYANAVADELEGVPSYQSWLGFRRTLARAMLISGLLARARAVRAAKAMGTEFDFTDDPIEPVQFAKINFGVDDEGFMTGDFVEALESFRNKVPRLASEVRALAEQARQLSGDVATTQAATAVGEMAKRSKAVANALNASFWVSDVDRSTVVNLRALVADAIRGFRPDGAIALPDFMDEAALRGAHNLSRFRLETIYRVNTNRAYNEGQADILSQPAVEKTIPLVEIDEVSDSRTRETHAAMDGYINTIRNIKAQQLVPPNGFNCRAGIKPVPPTRARSLGLLNEDGSVNQQAVNDYNGGRQGLINSGVYPDPGFLKLTG